MDPPIIENAGNLVCPTSYDLGEVAKVMLLSVAEGEEQPPKYPGMFFKSKSMVLTKLDLLQNVPFRLDDAIANARIMQPDIEIMQVSSTTGEGLEKWMEWVRRRGL